MTAAALRKIEAALAELADNATDEHPVDAHELQVIVRQIGAQAEMIERGLVGE